MNHIRRLIAESARHWSLSKKVATWIFWIPLVGAAVIVLARLDKEVYRFLLQEDGVIEWAQFACFVAAAVAAAGVARFRFRAGHRWQAVLFTGLALAMLLATGEEVSWGQRIVGLETPEVFRASNKQQEISLHNIGSTLTVLKVVMMLGGGLGAGGYLINKRVQLQRYVDQADYLLVPPFFLASSFLVVFVYQFVRYAFWRTSGFTVTRYGEWSEFCLALGIAVFVGLNYRRLAADAKQESTAERACYGDDAIDVRHPQQTSLENRP